MNNTMEKNLQEKFKEIGMTAAAIAERSGLSKTTVSLVIADKYNGAQETVKKVESVINELWEERAEPETRTSPLFRLTPGQKQAGGVIELLWRKKKFGMVVGPSGGGKTTLVREVMQKHPSIRSYTATAGISMSGMLSDICGVFEIQTSGTIDQRRNRLIGLAPGQFLIIDEADNLTRGREVRHVLRMIEVFRKMYDAGTGICLVGLPSLYEDVCKAGETYVFSRIRYINRFIPPDKAFLRAVWKQKTNGLKITEAQTESILSAAPRSGFFRYIEELADTAMELQDIDAALAVSFIAK